MKYVYLLYVIDASGQYLEGAFAGKDKAEAFARAMHLTSGDFWIQELKVTE